MKRPHEEEDNQKPNKKNNIKEAEAEAEVTGFAHLTEDMMFEVFKHVDSQTLGRASCVSKKWEKVSKDERLWEMICSQHWSEMDCSKEQLRLVILAFGGFRLLHSYIRPILKVCTKSHQFLSSSSPKMGKDEFQLSLSLLSIRYYEKMDCNFKGRKYMNK